MQLHDKEIGILVEADYPGRVGAGQTANVAKNIAVSA